MRHRVVGRKLNMDIKERKALFKNLVIALITYGKIQTTITRAKAVYRLVDKLIIRAKDGSDAAIRQISSFLARKEAVRKLMKEVVPQFTDKIGGYLRIRRIGKRRGDGAEEVILEWSAGEKEEDKLQPGDNKGKKKL